VTINIERKMRSEPDAVPVRSHRFCQAGAIRRSLYGLGGSGSMGSQGFCSAFSYFAASF
jgi:hypothetical protein